MGFTGGMSHEGSYAYQYQCGKATRTFIPLDGNTLHFARGFSGGAKCQNMPFVISEGMLMPDMHDSRILWRISQNAVTLRALINGFVLLVR